jgi:isoleucyl-tRNA synthetase
MEVVRKVAEAAHAARREKEMKVRQPLATVKVFASGERPPEEVLSVLFKEINVKNVEWAKSEQFAVELDTNLTPELVDEGKARDIMRQIQDLRKQAGVQVTDIVKVQLPEWPQSWEEQIKAKTKVSELVQASEAKLL